MIKEGKIRKNVSAKDGEVQLLNFSIKSLLILNVFALLSSCNSSQQTPNDANVLQKTVDSISLGRETIYSITIKVDSDSLLQMSDERIKLSKNELHVFFEEGFDHETLYFHTTTIRKSFVKKLRKIFKPLW